MGALCSYLHYLPELTGAAPGHQRGGSDDQQASRVIRDAQEGVGLSSGVLGHIGMPEIIHNLHTDLYPPHDF